MMKYADTVYSGYARSLGLMQYTKHVGRTVSGISDR